MADLIQVTNRSADGNEGIVGHLDHMVGNRTYGQRVFLSGTEVVLPSGKRLFQSPHTIIPGVAPSVAYTSGDALGVLFQIPCPVAGTIQTVILTDMDNEALGVDLILFSSRVTSGTDNSAFDMTDADRVYLVGGITISTFFTFNDNAFGQARGVGLDYVAPQGVLWVQAVVRGAQNLTAATDYGVMMVIEDHGS